MERFDNYEQEYLSLNTAISQNLQNTLPRQSGEQWRTTVKAIELDLEEADEKIAQMEMELLSLPSSTKAQLGQKVRGYKANLAGQKRQLGQIKASAGGARERRDLLYGESGGDVDTANYDQRERLLEGTGRLYEGSRRLDDAHRVAIETENIGADILSNLRQQRDQIQNTINTVQETDSHVDRAQRTLRSMARRMITNRIITIAVILVLIALIVLVFYAKHLR